MSGASSREIDSAEVDALAEIDVEPLRHAAIDLDHDAITTAPGLESVDLDLAERVGCRLADDGSRTLELHSRIGDAVGHGGNGLDDRAADELVRVAMQILVVDARLRRQIRLQLAQVLARLDL